MIYEKINQFLQKTGKSFTTQTLSRRLKLNEDTTGKYLRSLHNRGLLDKQWTKGKDGRFSYRYRAV